uniref:Uncharacterized protein n=1 Tax=Rhizophora mucronata TaxID=61149 RepID=A0A2P2QHJ2_RHIMU
MPNDHYPNLVAHRTRSLKLKILKPKITLYNFTIGHNIYATGNMEIS